MAVPVLPAWDEHLCCTKSSFNSTNKQQPTCLPTNPQIVGSRSLPYCAYLLRYPSALEILGVFKIRPKAAMSRPLLCFLCTAQPSNTVSYWGFRQVRRTASRWLDGPTDRLERETEKREQDFSLAAWTRAFLHQKLAWVRCFAAYFTLHTDKFDEPKPSPAFAHPN